MGGGGLLSTCLDRNLVQVVVAGKVGKLSLIHILKISNIQIGYTFPKNVLKPVKMENARVFASVDNVCTISAYNKFGDPEVGDSNVL